MNFFTKLITDIKFAGTGEGHKLTNDSKPDANASKPDASASKRASTSSAAAASTVTPAERKANSDSAARAGQAALERFEKKQQSLTPKPRSRSQDYVSNATREDSQIPTASQASSSLTVVASNDTDDSDLVLDEDPLVNAVMLLRDPTVDGNEELRTICIATLLKYIENILINPGELKYRKIILTNKLFTERVAKVPGGRKLLLAIGFEEQTRTSETGEVENFLILPIEKDIEPLLKAKEMLTRKFEPNRDTRVFTPSASAQLPDLPDSFYQLTKEEALLDIQARRKKAETEATLRTRAMREQDVQKTSKSYRVACVRVRFPDGNILQGRFATSEPVSAVFEYVRRCVQDPNIEFALVTSQGTRVEESNTTILSAQFAPAILLHLSGAATLSDHLLAILEPL